MNADNVIYVRKIGNRWWVWHTFVSEDDFMPDESKDIFFKTKDEAEAYAWGLAHGIGYVEYGIVFLP